MAGTTGLEPATSAVTDDKSRIGTRKIRLRVRSSAPVGFVGSCWELLCNRFVQPIRQ